ncbi:MAG: outer membrane beta-barrel protein [Deltaproteobacteria bacterium]|nr:outer membrane beta-barrel protein [Deltaproteobacteria bacterium]
MRKLFSLAVMCSLAFPAMAFAQGPESPKEAADDLDAEYGREETVDSAAEVPAEPPPKEAEMKMPESPKMAADDIGLEEPDVGGSWKDGLSWQVMASAFYRIGGYTNNGVRAGTYNNILSTDTPTAGYPYTNYNGFGLNFAGGDVMYTGEKFAVRLDLRFGEGAGLLSPIAPIKQAYAAWMPSEKVNIDVGFFDTIFGAEVADEWNNANYTRGALYFLRQPFNHMGLRMGAELGKIVGFTAMVQPGRPQQRSSPRSP